MNRPHDYGQHVAPLHVDCLLSQFILTIRNNSPISFADGTLRPSQL